MTNSDRFDALLKFFTDAEKEEGQPPEEPRKFVVNRAGDDIVHPQPPIDWIVERLFAAPGLALIYGEAGSKKTYAVLDAAACIAGGLPWLGLPTRQCGVLVVDEESGPSRMGRRMRAILRGHDLQNPPLFYTSLNHFDVGAPESGDILHNLIGMTEARLVIVDSWAAASPSLETENEASLIQRTFNDLRSTAESHNAALVFVHHANRSGGYRGSSVFKGAVDTMLLIESDPGSRRLDFSFEKARDTEPFRFAAEAHFGDETFHLSPAAVEGRTGLGLAQNYVLRHLAEHGPASAATHLRLYGSGEVYRYATNCQTRQMSMAAATLD